jgi:hypothetical protein
LQSAISFSRIGPRRVLDVGLAAAELLEAAAGAADAHGHLDGVLLHLLEVLGHAFGDREDGRRAVDLDDLRLGGTGWRVRNCKLEGLHFMKVR